MKGFNDLADVVAPQVLLDAHRIGALLAALGVPHVLIGGLAGGLYGHPRATKDVDYLVGAEAFERTSPVLVYREELKEAVTMGAIDLLAVPDHYPFLAEQLRVPAPGEVPVIAVEALVLMKLDANRPQDRSDVVGLLGAGADLGSVRDYLKSRAPHLLHAFLELVDEAR